MSSRLEWAYERINWKKIHAYMVMTNWTWDNEVPSIDEMQATVQSLMSDVMRSELDNTLSATGGFQVNKWTWNSGVEYEIMFDIALRP